VGARIFFAEVEEGTLNLDPAAVEALLTARTRALIPVHLFGHPADVGRLLALSQKSGVELVEDAAQAHGAEINLQAAILRVKLKRLEEWNERRRAVAALYHQALSGLPGLALPLERPGCRAVYHLYTIRLASRDGLGAHLASKNIASARASWRSDSTVSASNAGLPMIHLQRRGMRQHRCQPPCARFPVTTPS